MIADLLVPDILELMVDRYPQICLKNQVVGSTPDYMAVFVGGFGDAFLGIMNRFYHLYHDFAGTHRSCVKSYYHWDGGSWGMLNDGFPIITRAIAGSWNEWGKIPVFLIGHSYGGSTAMAVARQLYEIVGETKVVVMTIDSVSRRQSKARAGGVAYWANAYLNRGGGILDVVPRIGGRWGECPDADINLPFNGYETDCSGGKYCHRRPMPMAVDYMEDLGDNLLNKCVSQLEKLITV